MTEHYRLYTDLAWLWPLWGDAEAEYAHYSEQVTALLRQHSDHEVVNVLVIGCGGGKNVFNLKRHFNVTGLDLSPIMLEQAQTLNPDCTFVHGDMRGFDLGRSFDAVLMDDAIAHMNNREDLAAAFRAAQAHLKPGGVMVVTPDVTAENFQQNKTTTHITSQEGLDVAFIENIYDPDPTDEQFETTILYLIREQGRLRIEQDHWVMGLYALETWRQLLAETGFDVHEMDYRLNDEDYIVFACKPRSSNSNPVGAQRKMVLP